MLRKVQFSSAVIFGLLLLAIPASAHHSFTAEFDMNKPIIVSGTVTKVEWINPHCYMYVDAKDASGKVTTYQIESRGTGELHRMGLSKQKLLGASVSVRAYAAKDGTKNLGYLRNIKFAGGDEYEVWAGAAAEGSQGNPQ